MKATVLETLAAKEEEGGGGREWFHQEAKGKEKTIPISGSHQNHLELRLGISFNNNIGFKDHMVTTATATATATAAATNNSSSSVAKGSCVVSNHMRPLMTTLDEQRGNGFGLTNWFNSEAANGFIHPWSLAARQQKAAFEKSIPSSSTCTTLPRVNPPPLPPVVGWPPVRAFRRNLVGPQPTKSEMDGEKDAKKAKVTMEEDAKSVPEAKPTMFVKVNMEGFAVGRKINLKAHDSYESLSRALQKMFNNFLSTHYSDNSEEDEVPINDYVLLYEDHEGDRMLVGDVPWELFIASVKRLYIAHGPKKPKTKNEDENVAKSED